LTFFKRCSIRLKPEGYEHGRHAGMRGGYKSRATGRSGLNDQWGGNLSTMKKRCLTQGGGWNLVQKWTAPARNWNQKTHADSKENSLFRVRIEKFIRPGGRGREICEKMNDLLVLIKINQNPVGPKGGTGLQEKKI